jgi:hypothetical protein
MLRKRDCQGSLALVEFFGCLWVAGWRQRDYPVLYNAFHIGDQGPMLQNFLQPQIMFAPNKLERLS